MDNSEKKYTLRKDNTAYRDILVISRCLKTQLIKMSKMNDSLNIQLHNERALLSNGIKAWLMIHNPEVVIIPDHGFDRNQMKKILQKIGCLPVMILGDKYNFIDAIYYMNLGVKGYIPDSWSIIEIQKSLTLVQAGKRYLKSEFMNRLISSDNPDEFSHPAKLFMKLTISEQKIILALMRGFSLSQISRMKSRSIKTVSGQKQSAMRKLKVCSFIELYRDYSVFSGA